MDIIPIASIGHAHFWANPAHPIYRSVASPNPRLLIPVSNYVDKI